MDRLGDRTKYAYHRNRIVLADEARLHTDTTAFKFGHAVIEETLACWNEEARQLYVFRLRDHCRRLWESMRITRLPGEYAVERFEEAALELLRANDVTGRDVCIRHIVYHGVPEDGPNCVGCTILLYERPAGSLLPEPAPRQVLVSSWMKLPDYAMPPRARSTSKYENARFAAQEAAARGFDDALMLNDRGKVAEYTGACAFFVRRGAVRTPGPNADILESITRDTCIRLLEEVHDRTH